MKGNTTWRLISNATADPVDLVAYPSALAEGRIAGKYMLSNEELPDTIVALGFRAKGIVTGADVKIDQTLAAAQGIQLVKMPRSGRGGPQPVGTLDYSDLIKVASNKFTSAKTDPDDPAVILYTSGTTGKPKGVTLTNRNFTSQTQMVEKIMPMSPDDKIILVLPLFHVYGLANGLVCGLYFGCGLSLIPQYSPEKLLNNIVEVKASILIAVPSMYIHILQLARARKTQIPKSLRLCVSGGAPLPMATINEFMELFQTKIAEGYGLTETTSAVSLNKTGEGFKVGSIGPASPGVEMKIVDDEEKECADKTEGEIVIRGGMVSPGYWNNPEETAETFKNGWLHTGDLGYRDEDGCFFITDRKKDLIIRGGFNISPREVEEFIDTHPKVEEAAVVGVRDKRNQENVKVYIVLKAEQTLSAKELLDYCSEGLAEYKIPKMVEFVEALPKSATGKILRKELRDGSSSSDRMITKEEIDRE
jgi:long-chain acyl-CoA synthetase